MSEPNKPEEENLAEQEPASEEGAEAAQPDTGGETEEALPDDPETLQARVRELEGKVAELQESVTTYHEQALRAKADGENMQRRAEKDVEQARKYALEGFLKEILPVKDSLEMALRVEVEEGAESAQKLHKGVEMTLNMLDEALTKHGVTEIHPYEERFDPNYHQAMTTVETEGEPNMVVSVMQKGYLLNDRLVRPAMVEVSTRSSGNEGEDSG